MSGQTMTTHQLASLCEVDEKTIRRWINKASDKMSGLSDKMSEAEATKKPAYFQLNEVLAIINAGGKHTMAALLAENAKGHDDYKPVAPAAVPSGALITGLIRLYGPAEAARRFDFLIGFDPRTAAAAPAPLQIPARSTPKPSAKYLEQKRKFLYNLGSAVRVDDIAVSFGLLITTVRAITRRYKVGEIATHAQALVIIDAIEREIRV